MRPEYHFGYKINRLPVNYRTVHHRGVTYYYYDGIYYRPSGSSYIVVRPPYGVTFTRSLIDAGLYAVDFSFYSSASSRGLTSQRLAHKLGLRQSHANAYKEYFYEDGIYYILNSYGEYVAITPPAGALVDELPYDAQEVVIRGYELYQVDDTIYRLIVENGQPLFEVVGQLY